MKTIIYYSSGREDKRLEQKVKETILKNTDMPIVSVTQFPTDFGYNICVGDVGVSGFNMFKQVQIALEHTDAQFVISCEADCLYPPDYFEYQPERDDICYRNSNLYVMPDKRDFYFYKKEGATHAQIIGRQFYLDRLNKLFEGLPQWSVEDKNFPKERHKRADIFDTVEYYHTKQPVVQIKTHLGMRYYTHSDRTPILSIPYWGEGTKVKKKYHYGQT